MVWKFNADRPIYQQIVEIMQAAILTGQYPPGERIPSVRDLAKEAQVNPNTMQHALQELERMNLLVTIGTNGRYVTSDTPTLQTNRDVQLQALAAEYFQRFASMGIDATQAMQLLSNYITERNEQQ